MGSLGKIERLVVAPLALTALLATNSDCKADPNSPPTLAQHCAELIHACATVPKDSSPLANQCSELAKICIGKNDPPKQDQRVAEAQRFITMAYASRAEGIKERREAYDKLPAAEKIKAEAEYAKLERVERDKLFSGLLTDTSKEAVLTSFRKLVAKLPYMDKFAYQLPKNKDAANGSIKRHNVPASAYLFDLRSVPEDGPNSPYALWVHVYYQEAVKTYWETLEQKRTALKLPIDEKPKEHDNFRPFYESIRNPSTDDLRKLYKFFTKIPKWILEAFKSTAEKDFSAATSLIGQNPPVYEADWRYSTEKEGTGLFAKARPDDGYKKSLKMARLANGELDINGFEKRGGTFETAVFEEKTEKGTSPFAKFLFRRGLKFTTNAQIIYKALIEAKNENQFIALVQGQIGLTEKIEGKPTPQSSPALKAKPSAAEAEPVKKAMITVNEAWIRTNPGRGKEARHFASLRSSTPVVILDDTNAEGWYKIKFTYKGKPTVGYTHKSQLKIN